MSSNEERLATLEERFRVLDKRTEIMDQKLDDLLHLRSRGVGIFWLTSSLVGTGIIGAFFTFVDWIRNVH